MYDNHDDPMFDDIADIQRFRNPGSRSALYPGKRRYKCPSCGAPNALSARDKAAGYCCNACADALEGVGP